MFVIGDVGNTETKIYLVTSKGTILKKVKLNTDFISPRYLSLKLKGLLRKKKNIKKILFCSVVPKVFIKIKKFIKKEIHLKCLEIKDLNFSRYIKVLVNKKQIGSDRVANAISVIDKKMNYIVVDFGTATTFDVIKNNKYYGGVIAPGIDLSLKTLSQKASLIPNIKITKTSKIIGRSTISSVNNGFFWGYVGLINNIIKMITKESKTKYKIIFTGGLSSIFKKSVSFRPFVDKDLTLKGLFKIIKKI